MTDQLADAAYLGAIILFILALGGLSNQETARRGNFYGMLGMAIALIAAVAGIKGNYAVLVGTLSLGGVVGFVLARRVQMTQMPELVAILHSLVGLAAALVGYATYLDPDGQHYQGAEKTIHDIEIYLGILIGAVTFSGSVLAFGKLSGKIGGKPLTLPGRHWLNLILLIVTVALGVAFVGQSAEGGGLTPLLIMTVIALIFGIHMVMAIGGADMPVVVSMLNSYSGWAAAATGFMLKNDLLIVV